MRNCILKREREEAVTRCSRTAEKHVTERSSQQFQIYFCLPGRGLGSWRCHHSVSQMALVTDWHFLLQEKPTTPVSL
jgi:hypothetical protein